MFFGYLSPCTLRYKRVKSEPWKWDHVVEVKFRFQLPKERYKFLRRTTVIVKNYNRDQTVFSLWDRDMNTAHDLNHLLHSTCTVPVTFCISAKIDSLKSLTHIDHHQIEAFFSESRKRERKKKKKKRCFNLLLSILFFFYFIVQRCKIIANCFTSLVVFYQQH